MADYKSQQINRGSISEILQILKNKEQYETIVKEGQGKTPTEFSKRQDL